jgi:hypothetical protein
VEIPILCGYASCNELFIATTFIFVSYKWRGE